MVMIIDKVKISGIPGCRSVRLELPAGMMGDGLTKWVRVNKEAIKEFKQQFKKEQRDASKDNQ